MNPEIKSKIDDLLRAYKFKLELHAHTSPASSCSEIAPEELVQIYKSLGYDAVVVTNHFPGGETAADTADTYVDRWLDDYHRARAEGERAGLTVLLGAEFHTADLRNDYLAYGIGRDDLIKAYSLARGDIAAFRAGFKNDRNLLIQAHPFRDGITRVDPSLLDGVETYNVHPHHNSRIGLAVKYAHENNLPAICGTDFHHHGHEGLAAVLARELPQDSFELARLIAGGDYLMCVCGEVVFN